MKEIKPDRKAPTPKKHTQETGETGISKARWTRSNPTNSRMQRRTDAANLAEGALVKGGDMNEPYTLHAKFVWQSGLRFPGIFPTRALLS